MAVLPRVSSNTRTALSPKAILEQKKRLARARRDPQYADMQAALARSAQANLRRAPSNVEVLRQRARRDPRYADRQAAGAPSLSDEMRQASGAPRLSEEMRRAKLRRESRAKAKSRGGF